MHKSILLLLFFYGNSAIAETGIKASIPIKGTTNQYTISVMPFLFSDTSIILNTEEDIKAKLIFLALKNAQNVAADANVRIAEIARRKANSSFLSSINMGANVNEFVVNNSPAANFFPKYNIGLYIPLDIFANTKAAKRTADELIIIGNSQKAMISDALKAKVLKQYEIYKEKKQLLELQRITTNDDIAAYEKAQKDYKDEIITIEDVNKKYGELINSRGNLVSKEKDLNISIIEIEEIIGVPLKTVLEKRQH